MNDHTSQRDYYQAELDYRRGQARSAIASRRLRRALRGEQVGRGDAEDWTLTTAR